MVKKCWFSLVHWTRKWTKLSSIFFLPLYLMKPVWHLGNLMFLHGSLTAALTLKCFILSKMHSDHELQDNLCSIPISTFFIIRLGWFNFPLTYRNTLLLLLYGSTLPLQRLYLTSRYSTVCISSNVKAQFFKLSTF